MRHCPFLGPINNPENVFVADGIRSKNSPPLAACLFTYSVKVVVKFDLVIE
jgi:hypothetical protein